MKTSNKIEFYSAIALLIKHFIEEKRACGYKYEAAPRILKCFDSFLYKNKLKQTELPNLLP